MRENKIKRKEIEKKSAMGTIMVVLMIVILSTIVLSMSAASDPQYGTGSGEGTGGQGVITKESLDNIDEYQTVTESISAGIPTSYLFTVPEFSIYQVILTGIGNETDISTRVELLKNTSTVTKFSPGNNCKNENLWIGSSLINDVSVRFKVENSKIDNAKLVKWDGNSWTALETKEINKDDNYTYIESKIDDSSILSLCLKETENLQSSPVETSIIPEGTNIVGTNIVPAETIKETPKKTSGFEILGTLIGISLIYYMRKYR